MPRGSRPKYDAPMKHFINVRLTRGLYDRLFMRAHRKRIDAAEIVRQAVLEYLEREEEKEENERRVTGV